MGTPEEAAALIRNRTSPEYAAARSAALQESMGAAHTVSASLSGGEPAGSPKPSKRLPSVIKRS